MQKTRTGNNQVRVFCPLAGAGTAAAPTKLLYPGSGAALPAAKLCHAIQAGWS